LHVKVLTFVRAVKKIQVKNQVASCQFLLDFADEDSNKKGFGQCTCQ
jgi:hypothetical protein